jgi:hypothetical protein
MGLDRLSGAAAIAFALLVALGCDDDSGGPPRLLDGSAAAEFEPVPGSVVASGRVLRGTALGRRFQLCRPESVGADTFVVERIGVVGESLTFADRNSRTLYACDGGVDAAGERDPPWCSGAAGKLVDDRLLDPRLDIGCRDRDGRPLAYAWVEPIAGARWIGVEQGGFTEVYEVLGGLPVRIATRRRIDLPSSRATFGVTQYDGAGVPLLRGDLEAAVAG